MIACTEIHKPDALGHQRGEVALDARGAVADGERAQREQREERDHGRDADEAELLADHREQEIGVRLRQVEQLLDAAAEADAEPFAASERDQRVRQLIALAIGDRPTDP